jgi:hypothetical protein
LHHIIVFGCALAVMGLLHTAAAPYVMPAANAVMLQSMCCLFFSNMADVLFVVHSGFEGGVVAVNAVGYIPHICCPVWQCCVRGVSVVANR